MDKYQYTENDAEAVKYVYALFDTMIDHNGNHTFSGDADKLREHVLAKVQA